MARDRDRVHGHVRPKPRELVTKSVLHVCALDFGYPGLTRDRCLQEIRLRHTIQAISKHACIDS